MAISTYKTYLMQGTTSQSTTTYTKLVDIVDFPDIGGSPESIDVTTLSDPNYRQIPGIQTGDSMEFTCNYDQTTFSLLKTIEAAGQVGKYGVFFGGTTSSDYGSAGKFTFDARLTVHVQGAGVNEAVRMIVTLYVDSAIAFNAGTSSGTGD